MKNIFMMLFTALSFIALGQSATENPRNLYGVCTIDSLNKEPFAKWFQQGFNNYVPDAKTLSGIKKQKFEKISIKIFFGTWCGDSKREVPRFLKILSALSFPEQKLQMIAVGASDSLYKQSPGHEESGNGIFRVPTIIIYSDGYEINRINEFPVLSLEKDLLSILNGNLYTPNYPGFAIIKNWINDGSITDENNSIRGMAVQIRLHVSDEHILNSLGYLLLKQNKKKEALQIFRINYALYPESSNTASSLGEGYFENNDFKKAVSLLERSLELMKDPQMLKQILPLLYKAKEKDKG